MKIRDWVSKFSDHSLVGFLLLAAPWILGSGYIWRLSSDSIAVPLTAEVFELPFKLLLDHRLILASSFLHPVLVFFSFFPLILLLGCGAILFYVLPRTQKLGATLLFLALYYQVGAPGRDPRPAADLFFKVFLLVPLLRMPPPLVLWSLASLGVVASMMNPQYPFPVFWLAFSLVFGHTLHFLLGDRAQLKRKYRLHPARFIPVFLALILLAFWVIASTLTVSLQAALFQPSTYASVGWAVSIVCFGLCWFRPQETARWLSAGTFGQGLLLSDQLNSYVFILFAALMLEFLCEPAVIDSIWKKIPGWIRQSSKPVLVMSALAIMVVKMREFVPERNFTQMWVNVYREISVKQTPGFLIVGRGLPFLAHFVQTPLIQDDHILLKTNEEEFKALLRDYHVSDIIVDKNYLFEFWTRWIKEGQPPDVANRSIISRAITYQGKEVETSTLKLPALKEVLQVDLKNQTEFVWLKLKN